MTQRFQGFQGEWMTCVVCGKQHQSDPKVESGWTHIEYDGQGFYVCPRELRPDKRGDYSKAYRRVLNVIARKAAQ